MMIARGLNCAITNPLKPQIVRAVRAADLFMKRDPHSLNWIRMVRESLAEKQAA
jgi:hypothetical protein